MTEKEYNPRTLQTIIERAAGLLAIYFRPTPSGIIGCAYGKQFALMSSRGLALILSDTDRHILIRSGGKPLDDEPEDLHSGAHTLMPERLFEDKEVLHRWLARSVGHVSTLAAPRPRR